MKIDIILAYIFPYRFGHEKDFVPPLTGIRLDALTPARHKEKPIHQ